MSKHWRLCIGYLAVSEIWIYEVRDEVVFGVWELMKHVIIIFKRFKSARLQVYVASSNN